MGYIQDIFGALSYTLIYSKSSQKKELESHQGVELTRIYHLNFPRNFIFYANWD